jgi:hypothetical protein
MTMQKGVTSFLKYVKLWIGMTVHLFAKGEEVSITFQAFNVLVLLLAGFALVDPQHVHHYLTNAAGWYVLFLMIIYVPYRLWAKEHDAAREREAAEIPRVSIEPYEQTDPHGAIGRAFRTVRLWVRNETGIPVRNCEVRMRSFVNNLGHESKNLGMRFKLTSDQPAQLQEFNYTLSFNLHPHGQESIDIAAMDEREAANPRVFMLYAMPGGGGTAVTNAIATRVFPHRLVVEVSAENLPAPVRFKCDLSIDNIGRLRMVSMP